jgi:hypothetical protein
MKIKTTISIIFFAIAGILIYDSCKKEKSNCGPTSISKYTLHKSHHTGEDCLECHKEGSTGNGCFVVGGTVYDTTYTSTYPNATVNLYSDHNGQGELKATLAVDGNGNFYSTDVIRGVNVYPAVTSLNGKTQYMTGVIAKGSCNGCHGVTTAKIWVR